MPLISPLMPVPQRTSIYDVQPIRTLLSEHYKWTASVESTLQQPSMSFTNCLEAINDNGAASFGET